ncbi:unnamed protein product [Protopolystoma xenopodis]|uniref:G-protein coupled receptors family 1 profile domain-containing protein n=1 Tax=Protopolystoma xenopodis TaxID=117903 RepID=A0A3S5B1R2_9PLAT|nr:unnamed protein product [Protopolystoma xenopodis]
MEDGLSESIPPRYHRRRQNDQAVDKSPTVPEAMRIGGGTSGEVQLVLTSQGGVDRAKTLRIVKMLAVVIVVFGMSYLPLMVIFSLFKVYHTLSELNLVPADWSPVWMPIAIPIAQWLYASNSCVNPWIYCFYSRTYRESFRRMLLCCRGESRTMPGRFGHSIMAVSSRSKRCHSNTVCISSKDAIDISKCDSEIISV